MGLLFLSGLMSSGNRERMNVLSQIEEEGGGRGEGKNVIIPLIHMHFS